MPEHPPPLPHPPHGSPPHVRERGALIKSLVISTVITAAFYLVLNYFNVPAGGSVPASVALWTGLVVILAKLLTKHP